MCVPICGRFFPNEGGIAGYVDRMRDKYIAKWGVQMAGMNFQTRSNVNKAFTSTHENSDQVLRLVLVLEN